MGAAASALDAEKQKQLFNDMKDIYEKKLRDAKLDDDEIYAQMKVFVDDSIHQHMEENSSQPKIHASLAVSATNEDDAEAFKIGDVVKASSPGENMKFEGIAVAIMADSLLVDFGDDEEPVLCYIKDCQRILNGMVLEVDDVVQCKLQGSALLFIGKVVIANIDGTYDIGYNDSDEIDENVPLESLRKIKSGRSSAIKKFRKGVNTMIAARTFSQGWDTKGAKKLKEMTDKHEASQASASEAKESQESKDDRK
jgi:hypothetical protein